MPYNRKNLFWKTARVMPGMYFRVEESPSAWQLSYGSSCYFLKGIKKAPIITLSATLLTNIFFSQKKPRVFHLYFIHFNKCLIFLKKSNVYLKYILSLNYFSHCSDLLRTSVRQRVIWIKINLRQFYNQDK